jgi:hypothetical protein
LIATLPLGLTAPEARPAVTLPLISAVVTPNSAITARIFAMSMVRDKARVEQPVGKMEVLLLDIMCAPKN